MDGRVNTSFTLGHRGPFLIYCAIALKIILENCTFALSDIVYAFYILNPSKLIT